MLNNLVFSVENQYLTPCCLQLHWYFIKVYFLFYDQIRCQRTVSTDTTVSLIWIRASSITISHDEKGGSYILYTLKELKVPFEILQLGLSCFLRDKLTPKIWFLLMIWIQILYILLYISFIRRFTSYYGGIIQWQLFYNINRKPVGCDEQISSCNLTTLQIYK